MRIPASYDIRADALIARVSPGGRVTLIIDRVAIPLDGDGRPIGDPLRLTSYSCPLEAIADLRYTVNGVNLSVAEIAEFVRRVVDDLKTHEQTN